MLTRSAKWLLVVSSAVCIGLLLLALGSSAQAGLIGSYAADSHTLHLYHLNESANNVEDHGYADGSDIDMQVNGAAFGATAHSGFGTSIDMGSGTNVIRAVSQPVSQSQLQGSDGAFTYEALVKVGSITADESQALVSLSKGETDANQSFQFRISAGKLQFIQVEPSLKVVEAAIPTTGANAFAGDNWYHVAAAYNGQEGVSGNTSLYWTKVTGEATAASLLGSGTLDNDVSASSQHFLAIGNRISNTGEDNLRGLIDEVRISDIARGAGDFMFSIPEPNMIVLIGLGAIGLLAYAWRKRR
jgi:hypothetical protein